MEPATGDVTDAMTLLLVSGTVPDASLVAVPPAITGTSVVVVVVDEDVVVEEDAVVVDDGSMVVVTAWTRPAAARSTRKETTETIRTAATTAAAARRESTKVAIGSAPPQMSERSLSGPGVRLERLAAPVDRG
jgi:hypothetical protein